MSSSPTRPVTAFPVDAPAEAHPAVRDELGDEAVVGGEPAPAEQRGPVGHGRSGAAASGDEHALVAQHGEEPVPERHLDAHDVPRCRRHGGQLVAGRARARGLAARVEHRVEPGEGTEDAGRREVDPCRRPAGRRPGGCRARAGTGPASGRPGPPRWSAGRAPRGRRGARGSVGDPWRWPRRRPPRARAGRGSPRRATASAPATSTECASAASGTGGGSRVAPRSVTVTATRSPGRMTSTTMSSAPSRWL